MKQCEFTFEVMFSVCCHPKILLPWQRHVTTYPPWVVLHEGGGEVSRSLLRLSVFLHNEFLSGCVKTQIACVVCPLVEAHIRWFQKIKIKMFMFFCFLIGACYTLNVRSWGKQLNLFEKYQDLKENKTNWFPRDLTLRRNVRSTLSVLLNFLRLSLQQQQKNNRSEPKQSTRYL